MKMIFQYVKFSSNYKFLGTFAIEEITMLIREAKASPQH